MPSPLTDAARTAILEDIRSTGGTPDGSVRKIAARHNVSTATVRRIAQAAEMDDVWSRDSTEKATRARVADMAAARAALQERWLLKANEALDRSEAPAIVYSFSAATGMYSEHILDQPPASDYRSFVTAAAVATDKLVALAKFDAGDNGLTSAVSAIDRIMDVVRGAHPETETDVES